MGSITRDILLCNFKFLGIRNCELDDNLNLVCVGEVATSNIVLPHGLKGLIGVGFSGLNIESIKFNKDLIRFELTALTNCSSLKEVTVYEEQLELIKELKIIYPNLYVSIHRSISI